MRCLSITCFYMDIPKVQQSLMASGYGKGELVQALESHSRIEVCHDQLCSAKKLQKYLHEEVSKQITVHRIPAAV